MSQPELFVNGAEADLQADPGGWIRADGHVLAHGRDPYFPPWPDVVQLDAFSPALRAQTIETLAGIAGQCDGIRCDMAMLMTNQVFAKTWGGRTGPEPDEEFWPAVIAGLRDGSTRRPCSSPRPTGTWSGRCSSRASTSATTSGSMTGSWAGTRPASAPT